MSLTEASCSTGFFLTWEGREASILRGRPALSLLNTHVLVLGSVSGKGRAGTLVELRRTGTLGQKGRVFPSLPMGTASGGPLPWRLRQVASEGPGPAETKERHRPRAGVRCHHLQVLVLT